MRFEIYLEFVNAGLNQINKWINKGPIQGHVKIIEGLRKKNFIPNNKKEKVHYLIILLKNEESYNI